MTDQLGETVRTHYAERGLYFSRAARIVQPESRDEVIIVIRARAVYLADTLAHDSAVGLFEGDTDRDEYAGDLRATCAALAALTGESAAAIECEVVDLATSRWADA